MHVAARTVLDTSVEPSASSTMRRASTSPTHRCLAKPSKVCVCASLVQCGTATPSSRSGRACIVAQPCDDMLPDQTLQYCALARAATGTEVCVTSDSRLPKIECTRGPAQPLQSVLTAVALADTSFLPNVQHRVTMTTMALCLCMRGPREPR